EAADESCRGGDPTQNPDAKIAACTREIQRWRGSPNVAVYYHNRAMAWQVKGECDLAITDLSTALTVPNIERELRFLFYLRRGNIYDDCKADVDNAIADFTRASNVKPEDGSPYINRSHDYLAKGDYDRALSDINKGLRIVTEQSSTPEALAKAYEYRADI